MFIVDIEEKEKNIK